MGDGLHGCARTTPRIRAELQASQASARSLARQYGLNPKTVAKWRTRATTADAPMGPRRRSTVLTEAEEAVVVEFRRRTLLPLDDLLGCLRGQHPRADPERAAPLPAAARDQPAAQPGRRGAQAGPLRRTPLGYVHLDSCEVRSAEGKRHLFLAIDRVTKFAYAELHPRTTMAAGATFLQGVIRAFPYAIHTVLTDNGTPFADQPRYRDGPTAVYGGHPFDRVCRAHGIRHKLTRPYQPWTNGQAERMVRTVKDATVKAYHYATHADLEAHVRAFLAAYNFAKHLRRCAGARPSKPSATPGPATRSRSDSTRCRRSEQFPTGEGDVVTQFPTSVIR